MMVFALFLIDSTAVLRPLSCFSRRKRYCCRVPPAAVCMYRVVYLLASISPAVSLLVLMIYVSVVLSLGEGARTLMLPEKVASGACLCGGGTLALSRFSLVLSGKTISAISVPSRE